MRTSPDDRRCPHCGGSLDGAKISARERFEAAVAALLGDKGFAFGTTWRRLYDGRRVLGGRLEQPHCLDEPNIETAMLAAIQAHMKDAGYDCVVERTMGGGGLRAVFQRNIEPAEREPTVWERLSALDVT